MVNQKQSRPQLLHSTEIFTESGEQDQSARHACISSSCLGFIREMKKKDEMGVNVIAKQKKLMINFLLFSYVHIQRFQGPKVLVK